MEVNIFRTHNQNTISIPTALWRILEKVWNVQLLSTVNFFHLYMKNMHKNGHGCHPEWMTQRLNGDKNQEKKGKDDSYSSNTLEKGIGKKIPRPKPHKTVKTALTRNRYVLVTRQQLLVLSFKILIKALKYAAEQRYLKAVLCHKDIWSPSRLNFKRQWKSMFKLSKC